MDIKDYTFQLRMSLKLFNSFKEKCITLKRCHSDMVREIITAFVEGRLRIKPTENQKAEDIYHVD